jgi:Uma2 family endonuclease
MIANVDTGKITVATFHQMEFDEDDTYQYELLDGELVKKNGPTHRAPAISD